MTKKLALIAMLASTGCTTLGPMPAITAQNVVPAARPGVEAQVAAVPGYYLSQSVQEDQEAKGIAVMQGAVMVEPGELVEAPGFSIGGRFVGDAENGGYPEPMLRYRTYVGSHEVFALGGVVYGGYGHGKDREASYEVTRGGAELGFDVRATPKSSWAEVHIAGSLGFTGLDANGDYCLDANGRWGVDCPKPPDTGLRTHAEASGFYPSAAGAIALDLARHLHGVLHGGRIALHGAVGRMPRVEYGEQISAKTYTAAGLSVTLGLGAVEPKKR